MCVLNVIRDLRRVCEDINADWGRCNRTLESFPEIVWAHTESIDLTPLGDLENILTLLEDPDIARHQQPSSFSDLYLKLVDNGHFGVEILNWWKSDINVHDHDFSGVQFQLAGDSLNIQYSFSSNIEYEGVNFGWLSVNQATRWTRGSRSLVLPGRQAPHNVCHLGFPTVSLLIRTHPNISYGPQWNYFSPGVSSSYGIADACFRKRLKGLRLLARGSNVQAFEYAFRTYMAGANLRQVLFSLLKMIDFIFEEGSVHLVHELLESNRPYISDVIRAVAIHRAAEVIKSYRWSPNFDARSRELFAILGSTFDIELAELLAPSLILDFQSEKLKLKLDDCCGRLPKPDAALLRACLQLFS